MGGNYIFNEVANTGTNKLVFGFGTTTTGTINIFIIKDASWGKISVSMTGSAASSSRIYTEIHGTGSSTMASHSICRAGCYAERQLCLAG